MVEATDGSDIMDRNEAEEIMEYVKKNDKANLSRYLEKKMDDWRNISVKIAITGETGVGKSSLINAFLNVSADDPGAAEVGTSETTTTPTRYCHPSNSNVDFWDLPGVGTTSFPQDSYLEKVNVEQYDFFLLLSDRRFTEYDAWLCRELKKLKKDFFFVRTKFDEAVQDDLPAAAVLEKIRSDVQRHLKSLSSDEHSIYVLSNFETDNYDFPKLLEDIFKRLPDMKERAMVLTLGNISKQVIKSKKKQLKRIVWMIALASGVAGAIPLPGVDLILDIGILLSQTKYFLERFGLDDKSIEILAQKTGTEAYYYKQVMVKSKEIRSGIIGITSVLKTIMKSSVLEIPVKVTKFLVPVLGSVIGAVASFGMTYHFFSRLLDDMENDALAVFDKMVEKQKELAHTD